MCSQDVRQHSPPQSPRQVPAITPAANIPRPLTSFVGREAPLRAVIERLQQADVRLLTLAGPAGVGKTRLALAAATRIAPEFADGAHFIPCASLRDPSQFPAAIAEHLDIHPVGDGAIEPRIIDFARNRSMLLVLDNLEHLLPLPFIARILTACHQVRIMTTSRTVLHLTGEHEYIVAPLNVPDVSQAAQVDELTSIESVSLLISRARQVNPDFEVDDTNRNDVAAICARLDGLPLAIELAAARLKVFSPAALHERLSDQLALLVGGPSDLPPHQQTIRDTIGWSHDLLPPEDQLLLRRLAVFSGGITPGAAARVCHDDDDNDIHALDGLTRLGDQSLLQVEHRPDDGPVFFLLESVRQFAESQLRAAGESDVICRRHAEYFLTFVEHARNRINSPDQSRWIERLEREQPNIRDALQTFRGADDAENYTRMACAMFRFWRIRGKLIEGRSWLDAALDGAWESRLPEDIRSRAFTSAGWLAWEQGDTSHAETCGEEALSIAGQIHHDSGMAHAYGLLSIIDNRLGEHDRAIARMELSLKHHRLAGDADNIAGSLNNLALLAMDSGDFERAAALCAESRDAFTKLGNLYGVSHAVDNRGVALYCLGQFEEAMRCSRESLSIGRKLEDKRCMAISLDHMGKCARALGDPAAAWEAHSESLAYRNDLGDSRGLLTWLEAMALWLVAVDHADLAARTLGAIEVVRIGSTIPLQRHELGDHEETVNLAREQLGEEAYDMLFARGRWQSIEESVAAIRDAAVQWSSELTRHAMHDTTLDLPAISAQYGLTPRELDVLALIAQRYTDREIADSLFISHRTVARHVTGLFNKLDVHSRRDAATLVADMTTASPPDQHPA